MMSAAKNVAQRIKLKVIQSNHFQYQCFWSRSHNRFLVSVSISVSRCLVSVLALVSLFSGLINMADFFHTNFFVVKVKVNVDLYSALS